MSGPISDYELGKSTHLEYEAQFSRYWGQNLDETKEPRLTTRRRLALALRGALAGVLHPLRRLAF